MYVQHIIRPVKDGEQQLSGRAEKNKLIETVKSGGDDNLRPTHRDFVVQIAIHSMIIFASLIRWQLMARWFTQPWITFPILWALVCLETLVYQLCFDYVEERPRSSWNYKKWLYSCIKPGAVNALVPLLLIPFKFVPSGSISSMEDVAWSFIHSVWRVLLFEIGLDIAYYTRHKVWHSNKAFTWIHKRHHSDTGKLHGHLVTYETYVASWVEEMYIGAIYIWGVMPNSVIGLNWNFLDFAIAQAYMSYGEQYIHAGIGEDENRKETFFSRYGVLYWRLFTNPLNINLTAADHAAHHKYYSCNFAKRYNIWDKMFGTYRDFHEKRPFQRKSRTNTNAPLVQAK